jgi:transmembrane sensor
LVTPEIITLRDQSRATLLEPETRLVIEHDSVERTHVRLERGRARFEVTRRPERSFTVQAGRVTVSVVGTTFGVQIVADRVGVTVEQGAVEVVGGRGQKLVLAGENGWFPPLVVTAQPEAPLASSRPSNDASIAPVPSESPPHGSLRSAQQLLAEVDTARSAGQSTRAVELLRQLLRDYPNDPRAPLAAFTLGRVLLNELGLPREAEDALAREVEAWQRASEPQRARALAATYLERYPAGRHARRVRALAGLE